MQFLFAPVLGRKLLLLLCLLPFAHLGGVNLLLELAGAVVHGGERAAVTLEVAVTGGALSEMGVENVFFPSALILMGKAFVPCRLSAPGGLLVAA